MNRFPSWIALFSLLCVPFRASSLLAQLSTTGNQVLQQGALGAEGAPEEEDVFGQALAVGDFDGDGFDDLAVGVPSEGVDGQVNAGAVQIFFGSRGGIELGFRDQLLTQSTPGVPGASEEDDFFGVALAAMDFDCDGFDDLAVGADFETLNGDFAAGAVWVFSGSGSGLSTTNVQFLDKTGFTGRSPESQDFFGAHLVGVSNGSTTSPVRKLYVGAPGDDPLNGAPFTDAKYAGSVFGFRNECDGRGFVADDHIAQSDPLVPDDPERYDSFGSSLGKGDFDGNGVDDLVVGVAESLGTYPTWTTNTGMVHVFYGSTDGFWGGAHPAIPFQPTSEVWHQGRLLGTQNEGDYFGNDVAAGDFDGDGFDDLVAGIPGESEGSLPTEAGAVAVVYGSAGRLSAAGDQLWTQAGSVAGDIPGSPEAHDVFGDSVAVGDFDGDGAADLAVGASIEAVGSVAAAGSVSVLYGRSGYGLDAPRSQIFDQDSPGMAGVAQTEDLFGRLLAAGDFNGDGRDDLAIGVPLENLNGVRDAGAVQVLYGSNAGVLGTVGFTSSGTTVVVEGELTRQFRVRRLGPTNLTVTVDHRLATGASATLGSDFQYTPGTLTWQPFDASDRIITVRILQDTLQESTEFATVELVNPSAGTALVAPTRTTVQINDDGNDFFFADGFLDGTTNRWAQTVRTTPNNLRVTGSVLQVELADAAPRGPAFVLAGPGQGFANEQHIAGSFLVDPQDLVMSPNAGSNVFQMIALTDAPGATGVNAKLAFDLVRGAGNWLLVANFRNDAGVFQFAGGGEIAAVGAVNGRNVKIEYDWRAGNPGRLTVFRTRFVNGIPDADGRVQLCAVDLPGTASAVVNHVHAGMVAGQTAGTFGILRLDEFTFRR